MKLERPYYVQTRSITEKYHPVAYGTLEEAERMAALRTASDRTVWAEVWDCTGGPSGVLVGTYANGSRREP